ncbi:MAG: hydrogenase maturation protease [Candidatus Bipolaricaulota bacterium]|nr:hydrogenase maturation protease [Candidatus Bipolaricaulota bacterium]
MKKVLLGIGNPLGRDDALGLRLAEGFAGPGWVALPAPSVENALRKVKSLEPDLLVVVDAAEMGLPPGSIRRLPLHHAPAMLGSTHGLPLPLLLRLAGIPHVVLIGVEPKERGVGEGISPEVAEALSRLARILAEGRLEEIPELVPDEAD